MPVEVVVSGGQRFYHFLVRTVDDTVEEPEEFLHINVVQPDSGASSVGTGVIYDNDAPLV